MKYYLLSSENNDDEDQNRDDQKSKTGIGPSRFLTWYGNRRRKGMLDDSRLTFSQYLVKIGMIFVFLLVDLIFYPSVIQYFIPMSIVFYIVWGIGGLLLVIAEKKILDVMLPPQKIPTSYE